MVFYPPKWVPQLRFDPPDSVPIHKFMQNEKYGRQSLAKSRHPFTCGLSGRSHSTDELFARSELLARSLRKRMGWSPNEGTAWEKVVCIFSLNTIDYITAAYSVHRLSGIVTPANAAYSATELTHQLTSAGATALFTCVPLLDTALEAASRAGIARDKVFLLPLPSPLGDSKKPLPFLTLEDLISKGNKLSPVEALRWTNGQGRRQTAFLCYSSGTSGLPKAVMISHRNVIANVLQMTAFEEPSRKARGVETQVINGLLPFSHIYGPVVVSHIAPYRGDQVIVMPRFDFGTFLSTIQQYKIEQLILVPPIIIQMLRNIQTCRQYDLTSVRLVISGAAPLGEETVHDLLKEYPRWCIGQAYGMTETCTVVSWTSPDDAVVKSSGSIIPGTIAKLVAPDGSEITAHDTPGELLVQGPSVTLGYLHNEKATDQTFLYENDGRWIRTGDEAIFTLSPAGNEHIVIVDRIKELIKVKGHQVAPAELEAHVLAHEYVSDCAVIQVPDERAGEVPKAFVVRADSTTTGKKEEDIRAAILKHVEEHKAPYKWLKGGVEFLDAVPKSPSGKILRRLLRDREKETRRKASSKL